MFNSYTYLLNLVSNPFITLHIGTCSYRKSIVSQKNTTKCKWVSILHFHFFRKHKKGNTGTERSTTANSQIDMVADVFMEIRERVASGVTRGHYEYLTRIYINNSALHYILIAHTMCHADNETSVLMHILHTIC